MTIVEKKLSDLFDELVPASGKADTVAGEIVRAVERIIYRNWNDGDHIGVGYGRETCNPAARYLSKVCGGEVAACIGAMWGVENDTIYDKLTDLLGKLVLDYLDRHPDMKIAENVFDMYDARDPDEDVDFVEEDEWEDDDDWDEDIVD